MKLLVCTILFSCISTGVFSHDASPDSHKKLIPIPEYNHPYNDASGNSATKAIEAFLGTFEEDALNKFVFPLKSKKRRKWSNLPAGIYDREGISIGELSDEQRNLLFKFLASSLSKSGYNYVGGIMAAEAFLSKENRAKRLGWYPENYWLAIFGKPAQKGQWAWQFGGHHLAINMVIEDNKIKSMSPTFIGIEPAKFTLDGKNFEVLYDMHLAGYAIFDSLDSEQQKEAAAKKVPKNLLTGPKKDGFIPQRIGISATNFTETQQEFLLKAIEKWVKIQPKESANSRMKEIETEIDSISFAWIGSDEISIPAYMRIQGPTLIIELLSTGGNVGESAQGQGHYHTIYRNFSSDYGAIFH